MYDFHKKRSLNMDHVYYHELFQRGKRYFERDLIGFDSFDNKAFIKRDKKEK